MEESEELASQLEFASMLNAVDESMTDIPISTTDNTVTVVGPSTSSTPMSVAGLSTSSTALSVTRPSTSCTPLSVPGPSTSSTPLTSILGTPVRICTTVSPILQQLKAPTCSTKGRATPQARLLTSNESLAQLQEKEKKKKEQAEEKERKKQERAEKKRIREENLKKKQEEKARKAEERAKKQQEKKGKQRVSTRKQHKKHVDAASEVAQSLEMTEPSNAPCSELTGPSDVPHSSKVAGPSSSSERIVSLHALNNKDDVCDGDGAGWVSCHCGIWLHEDCVEEYVVSSSGVELFCPFCTDGYIKKM